MNLWPSSCMQRPPCAHALTDPTHKAPDTAPHGVCLPTRAGRCMQQAYPLPRWRTSASTAQESMQLHCMPGVRPASTPNTAPQTHQKKRILLTTLHSHSSTTRQCPGKASAAAAGTPVAPLGQHTLQHSESGCSLSAAPCVHAFSSVLHSTAGHKCSLLPGS